MDISWISQPFELREQLHRHEPPQLFAQRRSTRHGRIGRDALRQIPPVLHHRERIGAGIGIIAGIIKPCVERMEHPVIRPFVDHASTILPFDIEGCIGPIPVDDVITLSGSADERRGRVNRISQFPRGQRTSPGRDFNFAGAITCD